MNTRFGWGHININVQDLDASIAFYEKLGFERFLPAIPYLNLRAEQRSQISSDAAAALGLLPGTEGRACIMQLDDGFPKLDLTELTDLAQREPLQNKDRGLVRFCLVTADLAVACDDLKTQGVEFLSPPTACHERLADVAVCVDPDGTLIELLQVYLDRWGPFLA
jgi:catechol 2,3-dioxygenase-like lactoylglutathione lyase family enzyme